jgi:hypothetical protein
VQEGVILQGSRAGGVPEGAQVGEPSFHRLPVLGVVGEGSPFGISAGFKRGDLLAEPLGFEFLDAGQRAR